MQPSSLFLSVVLVATLITEKYGKEAGIVHRFYKGMKSKLERILVPISNPYTMDNLVGIANRIQQPSYIGSYLCAEYSG